MGLWQWIGVIWGVSVLVVALLYWESARHDRKNA